EVNSLNTILAIAIMFICCNGKILIFTEINNSKRGYPTFWTAPRWSVMNVNRLLPITTGFEQKDGRQKSSPAIRRMVRWMFLMSFLFSLIELFRLYLYFHFIRGTLAYPDEAASIRFSFYGFCSRRR
ncbi:hypothetical protein OXV64_20175, partial [Bacteroides fragilis]|uniref:hypothetical protein n=1 Tax=Bacteroides hominis TaxID=2763023 RepID=UPI002287BC02|nr:hypothetical protein [Bacteroides fragilis]